MIREATAEDVDLLVRLIREAFATVAARFAITPANWPRHSSNISPERVREMMAEGHRYFVLEDGGEPRGCVALRRDDAETVHLRHLGVVPAARGRGLGRALLAHALTEARRLGARRATLGILAPDADLRAWYERHGFTVTETKTWPDIPIDVTFMARDLEP